jgi:thioesterase domain-containing protein
VSEVTSVHPEGPYVVVGYSIGGALAFEMVRQLEQRGHAVALSVIIDSRFPPGPEDADRAPAVAALPRRPRPPLQRFWRRLVSLPVKRTITRSCIRFGRPLPAIWGIRTRYFWRMLATSRDAWKPGPVDAPVLIVGAEGTAATHRTTWASLSRSRCRVVEMPVGHLEMIREPFVQELAHHLETSVVQADREARRLS